MTARPIAITLGMIAALVGTGEAIGHSATAARPGAIRGEISADNGVFIAIREEGCLVTFIHPDVHELTGSLEGRMIEEGTLVLDTCTGEGFFSVAADFVGSVLGSELGTARMTVQGKLHSFAIIDDGHFVLSHGTGGLAGVHVVGKFQYTLGAGGTYGGRAHFDRRR